MAPALAGFRRGLGIVRLRVWERLGVLGVAWVLLACGLFCWLVSGLFFAAAAAFLLVCGRAVRL